MGKVYLSLFLGLLSFSTLQAQVETIIPKVGSAKTPAEISKAGKSTAGVTADLQGTVFFSVPDAGVINRIDSQAKTQFFLETQTKPFGLEYHPKGVLFATFREPNQVVSIDIKTKEITILAEEFEGENFQQVAYLAADKKGGVYFSDPKAGAVYYISPDKKISKVLSDLVSPEGVDISHDGKNLYVVLGKAPVVMAYRIKPQSADEVAKGEEFVPTKFPGEVASGKVFAGLRMSANFISGKGLTIDRKGNLYVSTPDGIQVFSIKGEYLATIPTQGYGDCAFGGTEGDTLYFTLGNGVYATRIQKPFDPYPIVLLGIGILVIFILILYLKINAFLALIGAALVVGFLSPKVILDGSTTSPLLSLFNAPMQVASDFGTTMGKVGLVIAFATIIGKALMESGAADRIVRFFTRLFGERMAPAALLASGFCLSIPVFFDNVFLLLVPLAKALRIRTGKNYLLYITAIGAGGAITHSLVPPTPGPIIMSEELQVDLGYTIMIGILVGIPLAIVGYCYAAFINKAMPVPLREAGHVTLEELEERSKREDKELPSLFTSVLPILLPVLFITSQTIFSTLTQGNPAINPAFNIGSISVTPLAILQFIGTPAIALLIAAIVSMVIVAREKKLSRSQMSIFTTDALDQAGMILLITSAGGAFGGMLKNIGVGDSLEAFSDSINLPLIVLAWSLAVLFKVAQGSGTVAMITSSQLLMAILTSRLQSEYPGQPINSALMAEYLGYHPVYLVMAIGVGSKIASWMNDSGFWVVCKMGGLTEGETFKSWTITLVLMGLAGLPIVMLLTQVMPLVP